MTINAEKMLRFYEEFEPVAFKYNIQDEKQKMTSEYIELEQTEDVYQSAELTKKSYGDILASLDMVYAEEKKSNDILKIYELIYQKVICQYINIDGMERLLSEKYIEFEWDMHLGINHKKHSMDFYRDHFLHQIRDAYMMHMLLEEEGLYGNVKTVLENPSNSKVSRFVNKHVKQQMNHGAEWIPDKSKDKYHCADFYYRNIIYMACYMAGIFHDIGYPEMSNFMNQRRIAEYIANLYNAETSGYNFGKLNALLQNSLLFRLVSFEEIQKRLQREKPDHGVLSAIIFLMHFYENGAIYNLEPYKKCAVELAALAIYNHTNEYIFGKKEQPTSDYYRISFKLNPIAYLLRLCDDLQEWDRIYFEISDRSNLIVCNKCHTPIIRKQDGVKTSYKCNCGQAFEPMFDYENNFRYRRIYNVIVCNNLKIEQKDNKIIFDVQYDLERLLHIAYISSGYAMIRVKELRGIKYIMALQQELPKMYLKYFVTANPILIKVQIVATYIEKRLKDDEKLIDDLLECYRPIAEIVESQDYVVEDNIRVFKDTFEAVREEWLTILKAVVGAIFSEGILKGQVEIAMSFYVDLCIFKKLYERINQKKYSLKQLEVQRDSWKESIFNEKARGTNLYGLVDDCFEQFSKMYEDISEIDILPEAYYKQFASNDYVYGCIERFVSTVGYEPFLKRDVTAGYEHIDAYTDLGVFQKLLEEIK